MSNSLSTIAHHPVKKGLRRGAQNRAELTRSPIYALNNDILLNIFCLYRFNVEDEEENDSDYDIITPKWDRLNWWYKLSHVCRWWRFLILESPSLLDLQLVCTHGVPVADMLAHSPAPLPITISYAEFQIQHYPVMSAEDERNALLAISHRDRVRRIAISCIAIALFEKLVAAMEEEFPILERLYLAPFLCSPSEVEINLTLPRTFQAPNLHHIHLMGVTFPTRSPLLTTMGGLRRLWLDGIPETAYFPPSYIVAHLSLMPQLETLGISFQSDPPHPADTAIVTHVTLPNLRLIFFHGVSAYLDGLLARITTPFLSTLDVHFVDGLTSVIPWLFQFMEPLENLMFSDFGLAFGERCIRLEADPHRRKWKRPLTLKMMCRQKNLQVSSVVQILRTLAPLLSAVEQLTLTRLYGHSRINSIDLTQWHELLRSFGNVKVLHVPKDFIGMVSRVLRSEDGEPPPQLLPNLESITYFEKNIAKAIAPLIHERQAAGHPVCVKLRVDGASQLEG